MPLGAEERVRLEHRLIAAITVADLKSRLLRRLQNNRPEIVALKIAESGAAVDVDVTF